MQDEFFQALYYQPGTVFGRQMRPFSLSHSLLLAGLDNGWLKSVDASRSELLHAVWICGQDHAANAVQLLNPPLIRMAFFSWKSRKMDYAFERDSFLQYISDYLTVPEHWESGSGGKSFRAPWQFHFVMILTQNFGMTINQAWNTPVSLARAYYDVWAESQGDESLVSQNEKRLMKEEGLI